MVKVLYNGVELTSNIGVISSIERTFTPLKNPETFGFSDSFVLNGMLTGKCITFSDFIDNQTILRNRISSDFKAFSITENNVTVFTSPKVVIKGISFPSNQFVGNVPFSINVESFPENYWLGYYGVTNPSNSYQYTENQDGTVELVRTISAKGFNTSSTANSALSNAKAFCGQFTGINNSVYPIFISGLTGISPCLKTISENPNRFDGSYSVSLTYALDQAEGQSNVLRYTTDVQSGIEGLFTVNLAGEVAGCQGTSITGIRSRYNNFETYAVANSGYNIISTLTDLCSGAISSGVNENPSQNKLSFNIQFTNDKTADTWFDYNTSLSTDYLTDISDYSFDARFQGKGDIRSRFVKVSGLYSSTNLFLLMGSGYSGFSLPYDLNPNPVSSGIMFNRLAGEINTNARFNNEPVPPSGLSAWDYNIEVTPSLNQYQASPLAQNANDGEHGYYVTDLNYLTRAQLSINGNARIADDTSLNDGIGIIKTQINTLKNVYVTGTRAIIEGINISSGNISQSRAVNFNIKYSSEFSGFTLGV